MLGYFSTPHEILVVGRINIDLLIRNRFDVNERSVIVESEGKVIPIRTSDTPTPEHDKVNFAGSLKEFSDLASKLEFYPTWGGGLANSERVLSRISKNDTNLNVSVVTPYQASTFFAGENFNYRNVVASRQADFLALGSANIPVNMVFRGLNKVVIRGPAAENDFRFPGKNQEYVEVNIRHANTVLINALNHADMTSFILSQINSRNKIAYLKPGDDEKHRTPITVITRGEIPRNKLVDEIYPQTTTIHNDYDITSIFFGQEKAETVYAKESAITLENKIEMILKPLAQLAKGIPTDDGRLSYRSELNTSLRDYVSMGRNGYLVRSGNKAFLISPTDKIVREVDDAISKIPGSTNGAGDAFASAVAYVETFMQGRKYDQKEAGAVLNMIVASHFGFDVTIREQDIVVKEYDLEPHYEKTCLWLDE